ncbi:MAG TPA: nuclear transport factor 2 family protein [Candidatus Acidoferrales bacterium]|jgi:ketosteroid isomerase-like protein|nr:nuclear transport factor 2 family protein [Candidatus Acidoferrales bacterium]
MSSRNKAAYAVRAADAAWLRAFTARDVDKSVSFCDERASMLVPNAPIATGKKAIAKLIAAGFALRDYKLAWRPDRAGVARSGELAYTSGKYKVSFKNALGETISDKGKYLMVWKKQTDGAWKVLFDMNNSDLPPSVPL